MTFTSTYFLIGLLPWIVLLFVLFRKQLTARKVILLAANSVFYIWGGIGAFIVVLCLTVLTWLFSVLLKTHKKKVLLAVSIIVIIAPLLVVKYTGFIVSNINNALASPIQTPDLIVPLGISFFTFEAVSFLCDVYRGTYIGKVSILNTYLYLTFFATVTSGPIVRMNTFEEGLSRPLSFKLYSGGIERIAIGLCKKVLVADKISVLADYYFNGVAAGGSYSAAGLWLGSIAYTLQLYFDFSGYTDMAIGIGQLLGFTLPENFNKPYRARNISEFWKRWHMSLTQWFRDYIYIPLGGNRCKVPRHLLNMLIVWVITGIWHGADWSFVIWGLGYFVLLALEKYIPKLKNAGNYIFGHFYALFFINLLWVPFRADNLQVAGRYIAGMFGAHGVHGLETKAAGFIPFLIVVIALCFAWEKLFARFEDKIWLRILKGVVLIGLVFLAVSAMFNASYVPYIYGNF